MHLCAKNQKKLMKQSREKPENPYFGPILGFFGPVTRERDFFFKNPAPSHSVYYYSLTSCKISERSYERFLR